jgi:hypothetical protein
MVDVSKKAAYLLCAAALALGLFNLANAGPATQRPQPVIIDTDIGDDIDDAFALAIALQGSTKSGATGYSLTDHRPPTPWRCCITSGGSSTAGASLRRPCSMQYPSCGCCSHRPAH